MKTASGLAPGDWLDRLQKRLGPRYVLAIAAMASLVVLGFTVINLALVSLFYGSVSTGVALRVGGLAVAVDIVGILLTLWAIRPSIRLLARWATDGYPGALAREAWETAVQIPRRVATRGVVIVMLVQVPTFVYGASQLHAGAGAVPVIFVAALETVAAAGLLIALLCERMLQPVVRRALGRLPSDFVPAGPAFSLRAKLLVGLPIVNVMTGILAAGLARGSAGPTAQLAVAAGASLAVSMTVSLILTASLSRSLRAPVDELVDATGRVGMGDLDTHIPPLTSDELGTLTGRFNRMVTELRDSIEQLRAAQARIVAASDEARRQVERDLHDGAQQQLVLVNLKLGLAKKKLADDPAAAEAALEEARGDAERALAQLRDLAHGIYPQVLTSDGLPGALAEAAKQAAIPASVDCDGAGRYPPDLEAAVYFCCQEALQNAAKHAGLRARASVTLSQADGELRFAVADDGAGFDATAASESSGLQNMADRIGALGGELTIDSAPGNGTTVSGIVNVASEDDEPGHPSASSSSPHVSGRTKRGDRMRIGSP
jgi:signal transduction histidine kinase